jgi:hypothetical protein
MKKEQICTAVPSNTKILSPGATANKWMNVTLAEIEEFIACLLNMNSIRQPTITSIWFTSPSQNCSEFSNMFARN